MSIEARLGEETARAERREDVFYAILPHALLAASTVLTLLLWSWDVGVDLPVVLALTAVATLWLMWPIASARRGRFDGAAAGAYYAGLMGLSAGLVFLAPWYGVFAFGGFIQAFLLLRGRWRYVGVVTTSTIMALSYIGGGEALAEGRWGLWGAISAVTVLLAGASFYFAESTDLTGRRQKRALAELHEANAKLAAAMAENAGLHAQLLAQAREAGALEERQRIAREIHDTLAQSLAGILTQLQAAEQTMAGSAEAGRHLAAAMQLARESLADARRAIHAVEPEALAGGRLPDAIGDVARRWSDTASVAAVVTVTGHARPLRTDVEVTLLRAAQEALANVAKHAGARRVGLTLSYMEDVVTLDVRDDGVGFPSGLAAPAASATGGFGLAGMRQRVQRLAGRLVIESEPGRGTALSATVPAIPAEAAR